MQWVKDYIINKVAQKWNVVPYYLHSKICTPCCISKGLVNLKSLFESKQNAHETSGSSLVCNFKITLASNVKMIVVGFLLPGLVA